MTARGLLAGLVVALWACAVLAVDLSANFQYQKQFLFQVVAGVNATHPHHRAPTTVTTLSQGSVGTAQASFVLPSTPPAWSVGISEYGVLYFGSAAAPAALPSTGFNTSYDGIYAPLLTDLNLTAASASFGREVTSEQLYVEYINASLDLYNYSMDTRVFRTGSIESRYHDYLDPVYGADTPVLVGYRALVDLPVLTPAVYPTTQQQWAFNKSGFYPPRHAIRPNRTLIMCAMGVEYHAWPRVVRQSGGAPIRIFGPIIGCLADYARNTSHDAFAFRCRFRRVDDPNTFYDTRLTYNHTWHAGQCESPDVSGAGFLGNMSVEIWSLGHYDATGVPEGRFTPSLYTAWSSGSLDANANLTAALTVAKRVPTIASTQGNPDIANATTSSSMVVTVVSDADPALASDRATLTAAAVCGGVARDLPTVLGHLDTDLFDTNGMALVGCWQDCHGDWLGSAVLDRCRECSGGNTGLTVDANVNCEGLCYQPNTTDICSQCQTVPGQPLPDCTVGAGEYVLIAETLDFIVMGRLLLLVFVICVLVGACLLHLHRRYTQRQTRMQAQQP